MTHRPLILCRHTGCNTLIAKPGYCDKHIVDSRIAFKELDRRKNLLHDFYNTERWHKTSRDHRVIEPLCRLCKRNGKIVIGSIVHHDPDLSILLSQGLDPCDHQYLQTICGEHHLEELRRRRWRR